MGDLLGESSPKENVVALVEALGRTLSGEGADVPIANVVGAIDPVYASG